MPNFGRRGKVVNKQKISGGPQSDDDLLGGPFASCDGFGMMSNLFPFCKTVRPVPSAVPRYFQPRISVVTAQKTSELF